MSKTVHAIYNIEFEDLGFIKTILSKNKIALHEHKAFSQSNLVQPSKEDVLIIMGGPMSVNDEDKYPFIKREVEIIQKHLENNGKIIGICLGAQLLAKALGSKIYKGLKKEIGWGSLKIEDQDKSNPILGLSDIDVLHWHGETFDLPSGCERLASNSNYSNQAFKYKDLALGLQFHIEVTSTGLESWYKGHKHELDEEKIDIEYLRQQGKKKAPKLEAISTDIFNKFF